MGGQGVKSIKIKYNTSLGKKKLARKKPLRRLKRCQNCSYQMGIMRL
jgi:hypothetical protein